MSARVIDNDLHIFVEESKLVNLLVNEYYFMDYCNGKYSMSVSTNSRFMEKCFSKKYHKKYNPTPDNITVNNLNSKNIDKTKYSSIYYSIKSRIKAFIKELLDEKVNIAIKEEKTFNIIECFSLQNEFELVYKKDVSSEKRLPFYENINVPDTFDINNESDIICMEWEAEKISYREWIHKIEEHQSLDHKIPVNAIAIGNERPTIQLSGGETVELTVQDLIDGKALGLKTVDEIGYFLLKHGTLKFDEIIHKYDSDL